MTRWLVIQRDYGQLGNRLHTHANALAWCIENQVNLLNLSFKRYSPLFAPGVSGSAESFFPRRNRSANFLHHSWTWRFVDRVCRSDKWLNRLPRIKIKEKKDCEFLTEVELNDSFKSKSNDRTLLLRAWDLRFHDSLRKHRHKIRKILIPNEEFRKPVHERISSLRKEFDCLVGVHARRGDYLQYLDGIHFHDWDDYRNWVIQTKSLMEAKELGKIGFLLCSDDPPTEETFDELPVEMSKGQSAISDLYSLSLCDYNLGPPSSFGTWVSWYGQVPRLILKKGSSIQSLEQFRVCSEC